MKSRLHTPVLAIAILLSAAAMLFAFVFPPQYFRALPECLPTERFPADSDPLSARYMSEVVHELENSDPDDFRYVFRTFIEQGSQTYMLTNFRNAEICFDVLLLIEDGHDLAGMLRTNGKSYPDELYDVRWKIRGKDGSPVAVFLGMHPIID